MIGQLNIFFLDHELVNTPYFLSDWFDNVQLSFRVSDDSTLVYALSYVLFLCSRNAVLLLSKP